MTAVAFALIAYFFYSLEPPDRSYAAQSVPFLIIQGEGLWEIAEHLQNAGIIRSSTVFKIVAVLRGNARHLRVGRYVFRTDERAHAVLNTLAQGSDREIEVRIPEGATIYEIDDILARVGVIGPDELIRYNEERSAGQAQAFLDGELFPDTYRFFGGSTPEDIVRKMTDTFREKADPVLRQTLPHAQNFEKELILASLLEKEIPDFEDRRVVAGLLLKRIKNGMPLQVDATICYAKEVAARRAIECHPITADDLVIDSPYNTYRAKDLPPNPIGNPGMDAIRAALSPRSSPYWFYLSDPATQKTIFSETFEEHTRNKAKYLGQR